MSYTIERTFEGASPVDIEVGTRDFSHLQQGHPSKKPGGQMTLGIGRPLNVKARFPSRCRCCRT